MIQLKNSMYNNLFMVFIIILHLHSSRFDKVNYMYNLLCLFSFPISSHDVIKHFLIPKR
jgi:hypothetical protein